MGQITIDDIQIEVVRKKIKTLRLSVSAPDGCVRISAPLRLKEDAVRAFAVSKLAWIEKQRARIQALRLPPPPEYITGEYHLVGGERCLLTVIPDHHRPGVEFQPPASLILYAHLGSNVDERQRVLAAWYRQQLKQAIPPLLEKWQARMGVQVREWGVKRMKTRWGTCNPAAHRIWVNLELARRSPRCLEYVVVHELVHLFERGHNARFKALMDQFLPGWRQIQKELKTFHIQ